MRIEFNEYGTIKTHMNVNNKKCRVANIANSCVNHYLL